MIKCAFENGSSTYLRHATVDGIILRGNEVLLNKRGSFDGKPILESGKWGLIGGFIDRDETISEAFQREAMEEAGCKVTNIRLLRVNDNPNRPKEDRQNITFVLVADFVSMIDSSSEEVQELKWFNFDNLPTKEEIAFDHSDDLNMFKEYLKDKGSLKILKRFPAVVI
jgi:8-oxo-dGTP diphosphatase